jgi:hypothetical protein
LFADAAATEEAAAAATAEDLSAQLLELLDEMKARSLEVLSRLRSDNVALDSTAEAAEANIEAVGGANERLAKQLGESVGGMYWTLGVGAAAVLAFFVAYVVMRVAFAPPRWTSGGLFQLLAALFRWLHAAGVLLADVGGPAARAGLNTLRVWAGDAGASLAGEGAAEEAEEL